MYIFDKQTEEKPTVGCALLVEKMMKGKRKRNISQIIQKQRKFPSFPMVAEGSSIKHLQLGELLYSHAIGRKLLRVLDSPKL